MRLTCPLCGDRDRREFYYYGASDYLHRPGPEAGDADWETYLTLRDNPAGVTKDLWYHDLGCSAWLEVTRNTVTHVVLGARMIAPPGGGTPAKPETARAPRKPKGAGA
jgi:methylglutamate dehydrogenase subunit B